MPYRTLVSIATLIVVGTLIRASCLTGDLRDRRVATADDTRWPKIIAQLRSDFGRMSIEGSGDSAKGYFVYYEGPGVDRDADQRRGDVDDYVAFTIKAPANRQFSGTVPWGALEAKRAAELGAAYEIPNHYDPSIRKTIESEWAEVAYWAVPASKLVRDARVNVRGNAEGMDSKPVTTKPVAPKESGPFGADPFVLVRRQLLIRPDLNITADQLAAADIKITGFDQLATDQPALGYLRSDGSVEPCGSSDAALDAGDWGPDAAKADSPAFLTGLARVQQTIDLSVARETHRDRNAESVGCPSRYYSANTLEQLRQPGRRFAHVNAPIERTGSEQSASECAVAILALSATPQAARDFTGVRSEFASRASVTSDAKSVLNDGDVNGSVCKSLLAFDLQLFDAQAPVILTCGADELPGVAGSDDNGNGITDHPVDSPDNLDLGELGAMHSDDLVVTPSQSRFREVIRRDASDAIPIARGTFVDLGYAVQPGGNVGLRLADDAGARPIVSDYFSLLTTPYSGVRMTGTTDHPVVQFTLGPHQRSTRAPHANGPIEAQQTIDTFRQGSGAVDDEPAVRLKISIRIEDPQTDQVSERAWVNELDLSADQLVGGTPLSK